MKIKKDCFAYIEEKNECNALTEIECEKCPFYKNRNKIKNNPFYAYSYDNKKKHKRDMEKTKIKKSQVIWK